MNRLDVGFLVGSRFRLERRIAAGGMGEVWAATDERLRRNVALKIMHPSTADEVVFAERFRDEARHGAQLSHINIAAVFDYGEDDGLTFLIMELVHGPTLAEVLRENGALPADHARSIIGQTALALAVAHDAGIVHRDVKPANILIGADGIVKLTDFGIARAVNGLALTRTGEILGTPYYLSPEQALGGLTTPASDVYALGVVAHEMLVGAKPFDAGTPIATALAQVNDPPPPLPVDVPEDLARIVAECLAKDSAGRPATARSIAMRLGLPAASDPPQTLGQATLALPGQEEPEHTPFPTLRRHADPADRRARPTRVSWYWIPVSILATVAATLAVALTFL